MQLHLMPCNADTYAMRTIYIHVLVHAAMPINQTQAILGTYIHMHLCVNHCKSLQRQRWRRGKIQEQSNHESWDIRYVQKMDIDSLRCGNSP